MSSNSIGKNIVNAFEVIHKTYESVEKLMSYLQNQATEKGEYICCSDKFLRWSSDKNIYGWAYSSFILIFQSAKDTELENGWRDGPVYIYEINLYDNDEAIMNVARYNYDDISSWSDTPISPGDHGKFYQPLYDGYDVVDYTYDGNNYQGTVKSEAIADKRYWGLRSVAGFPVTLMDITTENAYDIVFGGFDKLAKK